MVSVVVVSDVRELSETVQRQIADVYVQCHETSVDEFLERQLRHHGAMPGFRLAYVTDDDGDGRVVGFAYGLLGTDERWWTQWLLEHTPDDVAREWIGNHFEFAELAVLPDCRRGGLATRLLEAIDAAARDIGTERILLTTGTGNTGARAFYSRQGWAELFGGLPNDFVLLGRRLA